MGGGGSADVGGGLNGGPILDLDRDLALANLEDVALFGGDADDVDMGDNRVLGDLGGAGKRSITGDTEDASRLRGLDGGKRVLGMGGLLNTKLLDCKVRGGGFGLAYRTGGEFAVQELFCMNEGDVGADNGKNDVRTDSSGSSKADAGPGDEGDESAV